MAHRRMTVLAMGLIFAMGTSAFAAERHMVAAAHPLAAEAGLAMLEAGGTPADAAVAVQTVLGLVEL